jgi:hypothetical protein
VKGEQRSAEQTPRKSSGPSFWLIAKTENGRIEACTVNLPDGEEALAVFGHAEEAEMFLQLEVSNRGWRIRESSAGEVVSVLYGPCKGIDNVVLDPLPRMLAERTVGLVSMRRERFLEPITTGGSHLGFVIQTVNRSRGGSGGLRSRATPAYLRKSISTAQRRRFEDKGAT